MRFRVPSPDLFVIPAEAGIHSRNAGGMWRGHSEDEAGHAARRRRPLRRSGPFDAARRDPGLRRDDEGGRDDGCGGRRWLWLGLGLVAALLVALLTVHPAFAQAAAAAAPAPGTGAVPPAGAIQSTALNRALGQVSGDGKPLSLSLQILILMSLLTVLPSLLLMMTSFTRIIIVLSILRQALGLQQTPPNQVLVGLSLFLTLFVMRPVIDDINKAAVTPYGAGQIPLEQAIARSGSSIHVFMVRQVRKTDLELFQNIAHAPKFASAADIPFPILLPAFVTSELKTAFQIGFLIFLPFLVIDLVVAMTLMSLGMMMLSPTIISMPFKLLLFVLVDGWALTMGSLAQSFG